MQLMTRELEMKFPLLYATEGVDPKNVKVVAKYFDPCSGWTWYATEYDPVQRLFFGFVVGFEKEFGWFSLDDLQSINGPLGLGIERDLYFGEHTLGELFPERFSSSSGREEG